MNAAYVYLQIYRLFDRCTPLKVDCGNLCSGACCKGEDCGMYLFPGEEEVYKLLTPDWINIERSDFTYTVDEKIYNVPLALCSGTCDRFDRPLACRIFPLTPYINTDGALEIIIDPRAKSVCPLTKNTEISDFAPDFVESVYKAFRILMSNKEFYSFMEAYSKYIQEYFKFFK